MKEGVLVVGVRLSDGKKVTKRCPNQPDGKPPNKAYAHKLALELQRRYSAGEWKPEDGFILPTNETAVVSRRKLGKSRKFTAGTRTANAIDRVLRQQLATKKRRNVDTSEFMTIKSAASNRSANEDPNGLRSSIKDLIARVNHGAPNSEEALILIGHRCGL